MTWNQFKPRFFERMEKRRAKAALFRPEQIYLLVGRCSKLFDPARQLEAEQALDRIAEEGTFLMLADTFSEFHALLSSARETTEDAQVTAEQSSEILKPTPEQPGLAEPSPETASRRTELRSHARQEAGRPFRHP
jgi:hypothetical protein